MKNLVYIRSYKKMTQQELAKKAGISRATIINLENYPTKLANEKTINTLCNVLDCKPIDLFSIDELINADIENVDNINKIIDMLQEQKEKCQ